MSPVIRSNWILVALVMLMSLAIYNHFRQQRDVLSPITPLDTHLISRIEIRHNGTITAKLRRQKDIWIDAASGQPAKNPDRLNKLLHIAQLPSLYRFPAADHDLQAFGLMPPRFELKLDDTELRIGGLDPASGLRYAQTGNQIHLISDSYTHYLSQQP